MPLLNPPDILPEAMRFLLRALLAAPEQRLPASTLISLISPAGMVEAMKTLGAAEEAEEGEEALAGGGRRIAEASLDALHALELVTFDGPAATRMVTAAPAVTARFADWKQATAPAFASLLRAHIFAERFTTTAGGGAGVALDLAEALALLHLAAEPLRPFVSFDGAERRFQWPQRDFLGAERSRWPVTNREQYQSFVRWAIYLGFAQPMPAGGRALGLVPDASEAVVEHLAALVPKDKPISAFVAELGQLLPSFDDGHVRRRLDAELTQPQSEGSLSPGLALTLNRLQAKKRIKLESRSDTAVLQFPVGEKAAAVSHIVPAKEGV